MNISRAHCTILAAAMAALPAAAAQPAAQVLPTVYEAGHFFATPETTSGQKFRLVVDTGGGGGAGMYWISATGARRLHLKTRTCNAEGEKLTVAAVPDFRPGHSLPPPMTGPCGKAILVMSRSEAGDDGQMGAGYLPGHTWTFDYPGRRLILEGAAWHPGHSVHVTALGFQRNDKGHPTSGFARITIRVDGQPLDMLLDTGATAHPTAAGEKASGTPTVNGYGVISYITTSVFNRWHKAHPDWRVVRDGDDLFGSKHITPIIEVPEVEIAGWSVGPVWFTERPDSNFHKFMGQWMDKTPEGAVGGNVFRHFVMTIDYPDAKAYFRCVRGCKPVATPPPAP